ncbi:hypothetical protein M9Y10_044781 [Tritrichomonas musculus]|uniref:Cell cycle control protein n=1 Tax=Tritrichomonas musculus TaxID=1915356 RepID=A0ABR2JUL4_9EUKA
MSQQSQNASDVNIEPIHKPLHHYRFTQQRLKGWRPVLTTVVAILVLLIVGAVLLALGLIFYFLQNDYNEIRYRYDDKCTEINRQCTFEINVENQIKGDLEIRYELTKFYQNQRRYGFSRDDSQLKGEYQNYKEMSNCKPYRSEDDSSNPETWTLPCGIFALSVFNDSFRLSGNNVPPFTEEGIAYQSEIDDLFKPLSDKYQTGNKWLQDLSDQNIFPGAGTNEHFIVWMRQAALPTIVKTYAKCDGCTLEQGKYTVTVQNRYPTTSFKGGKYFVIAKVTTLGTHNIYLGIIYIVCGSICCLYSIILLITELTIPRKMGEY